MIFSVKPQRGISLIEILIGLTLGSLLMLSAINIATTNKRSFLMNEDLGVLQENARFAFNTISRAIHMAGFRSPPTVGTQQPYQSFPEVFQVAEPLVWGENSSGVNGSDALVLRYQGSGDGAGNADGTVRDCANNPIDAGITAVNTLTVNNNLQLVCNNIALIDGVENMKVLYGEDLTNDRNANRYIPANFPGLNWQNIVSVRVAILIRSNNEILANTDTQTYNLLGTVYNPVDDQRIRRVFTATYQFRNLDPSGIQ